MKQAYSPKKSKISTSEMNGLIHCENTRQILTSEKCDLKKLFLDSFIDISLYISI